MLFIPKKNYSDKLESQRLLPRGKLLARNSPHARPPNRSRLIAGLGKIRTVDWIRCLLDLSNLAALRCPVPTKNTGLQAQDDRSPKNKGFGHKTKALCSSAAAKLLQI
jgi:hypothetical protein